MVDKMNAEKLLQEFKSNGITQDPIESIQL